MRYKSTCNISVYMCWIRSLFVRYLLGKLCIKPQHGYTTMFFLAFVGFKKRDKQLSVMRELNLVSLGLLNAKLYISFAQSVQKIGTLCT